jgi:hypothetical protein
VHEVKSQKLKLQHTSLQYCRVVGFDRDLRVAVSEEAGHLVQRRAGVEQLRRDGVSTGVRQYLLRVVRLAGQGVHNAPGLRDAQLSVSFLESGLTFVSTVKPDSRKDTAFLKSLREVDERLYGDVLSVLALKIYLFHTSELLGLMVSLRQRAGAPSFLSLPRRRKDTNIVKPARRSDAIKRARLQWLGRSPC